MTHDYVLKKKGEKKGNESIAFVFVAIFCAFRIRNRRIKLRDGFQIIMIISLVSFLSCIIKETRINENDTCLHVRSCINSRVHARNFLMADTRSGIVVTHRRRVVSVLELQLCLGDAAEGWQSDGRASARWHMCS